MAQNETWPDNTLCARCPRTLANHQTEAASHHEFTPATPVPVDQLDENFNG